MWSWTLTAWNILFVTINTQDWSWLHMSLSCTVLDWSLFVCITGNQCDRMTVVWLSVSLVVLLGPKMLVFPEVEFTFRGPIWIPVSRWLVDPCWVRPRHDDVTELGFVVLPSVRNHLKVVIRFSCDAGGFPFSSTRLWAHVGGWAQSLGFWRIVVCSMGMLG